MTATTFLRTALVAGTCTLYGCGAAPNQPANDRPARADDAWRRSVTWLHATDGDASGPERECPRVLEVLRGEANCKGLMCAPADGLAREWQDKCAGDEGAVDVSRLRATLETRLAEPPSPCVADYRAIVDGSCGSPSCLGRAQAWATRCAQAEGSPLSLGIVTKVVRRARGEDADALDPRSCDELASVLAVGARCADEADCRRATEDVARYDDRCSPPPSGRPLTVALQRHAILAGAGTPPQGEVAVTGATIDEGQLPLVLANRRGAVLTVCGRRVASDEDYLATRERCGGGPVTFGVLRAGKLAVVTLAPLGERSIPEAFPSFALAIERDDAERARIETFNGAIDAALANEGSLSRLTRALDRHAHELVSSVGMQRALGERDEQLAGLLAAAATEKVTRAKRFGAPIAAVRGLWQRGRNRPLADITLDGAVEVGAETTASLLVLDAWLPVATAAYRAKLAPLEAELTKAEAADAQRRTWSGLDAAEGDPKEVIAANKACLAAREQALAAERRVESCASTSCDEAALKAAEASLVAAQTAAVQSRHRYDRAVAAASTPPGPFLCDPLRL